ncbi:18S rRNA maturation protein [Geranomyces michiganensis]|nr:18S rRNA maturation protein [Geranomyces michiganensis]
MSQKRPIAPSDAAVQPAAKKARGVPIAVPTDSTSSSTTTAAPANGVAAENKKRTRKTRHIHPLAKKYGHHVKPAAASASAVAAAAGQPAESLASLRKKIRDAQRLLRRENLPADKKVELERRIKALNLQVTAREDREKEAALFSKYKYLRFVEQKKIDRRIRSLAKILANLPPDSNPAELTAALHTQRVNLAYTRFYPRDMKYLSLFPSGTSVADDSKDHDKGVGSADLPPRDQARRAIWNAVERCVLRGDKEIVLRRKDVVGDNGEPAVGKKAANKAAAAAGQAGEDDFFLNYKNEKGEGQLEEAEHKEEHVNQDANVAPMDVDGAVASSQGRDTIDSMNVDGEPASDSDDDAPPEVAYAKAPPATAAKPAAPAAPVTKHAAAKSPAAGKKPVAASTKTPAKQKQQTPTKQAHAKTASAKQTPPAKQKDAKPAPANKTPAQQTSGKQPAQKPVTPGAKPAPETAVSSATASPAVNGTAAVPLVTLPVTPATKENRAQRRERLAREAKERAAAGEVEKTSQAAVRTAAVASEPETGMVQSSTDNTAAPAVLPAKTAKRARQRDRRGQISVEQELTALATPVPGEKDVKSATTSVTSSLVEVKKEQLAETKREQLADIKSEQLVVVKKENMLEPLEGSAAKAAPTLVDIKKEKMSQSAAAATPAAKGGQTKAAKAGGVSNDALPNSTAMKSPAAQAAANTPSKSAITPNTETLSANAATTPVNGAGENRAQRRARLRAETEAAAANASAPAQIATPVAVPASPAKRPAAADTPGVTTPGQTTPGGENRAQKRARLRAEAAAVDVGKTEVATTPTALSTPPASAPTSPAAQTTKSDSPAAGKNRAQRRAQLRKEAEQGSAAA